MEYYSKYLVYGKNYLKTYIDEALRESKTKDVNDFIIIRACMLKYKEMMIKCFGNLVAKYIRGISVQDLVKQNYREFVRLVIELGTKTAQYVKNNLFANSEPCNDIDPNLSIRHINGLADYITRDTILDVKVQNHIDENMIRQVLGYHYLSTKRSDLHINRVIVYDAVSDKAIVVNIEKENQIYNF